MISPLQKLASHFCWLGAEDKIKHVLISCTLVFLINTQLPLFFSALITLAIGTFKELLDKYYYKSGFCWMDMLANVIGLSFGALLCLLWLIIRQ